MVIGRRPAMALDRLKYPRTPYWPYSPTLGRGDTVHSDPERFVGSPIVVTEKLDGSNVLIHRGKVYGRSVAAEAANKWMAMVKKHHAWKVTEPDVYLYGEDIYGVHSIEYGAVGENETFHAFALRDSKGDFRSMAALEQFAAERSIPVVPVLYRGIFTSVGPDRAIHSRRAREAIRAWRRARRDGDSRQRSVSFVRVLQQRL